MRWIFPRGLVRILRRRALQVIARREVQLPVIAEHDRAAVVLGVGSLRILVEDDLGAEVRRGEGGVGGEPREPVTVRRSRRIEDVVVVIGREVRVEGDREDALLQPGVAVVADVGQLQEGCRAHARVRRAQHLDRAGKLGDQHPAVGKEQHARREVQACREDLVLERARVRHVHGHRSRKRRVARRIARTRGQCVRTVRDRTGVPRQRVRRSRHPRLRR